MSSMLQAIPSSSVAPRRPDRSPPVRGAGSTTTSPVVVVANRLPGSLDPAGRWVRSPGGLVTALLSVLRGQQATWIGSHAGPNRLPEMAPNAMRLLSVNCTPDELADYGDGFSNGTLWPLYHDAIVPPRYDQSWWTAYAAVNERFAAAAAQHAPPGALVWIHDYHLQLVPAFLRARRSDVRIGYFHHIPFPHADLFRQLPWRQEIIDGLLGADLIGFQRAGDVANFHQAATSLRGPLSGEGTDGSMLTDGDRRVDVGAFPVPVDAESFAARGAMPSTIERSSAIRTACGSPRHLLLGVDRLDYTKGIDQRLAVIRSLFARGVLRVGRDAYLQVAVPSRADAIGYAELRARVERLVGDINGEFAHVGSPVVHYLHRSVDVDELTAMYRAADVMLVTPFRDGMNLVAKEYVASRIDNAGTLVLSEFTGAADEIEGALLVNPHDTQSMEAAIQSALDVVDGGRSSMHSMRMQIASQSTARWASDFLTRLEEVR